MADGAHYGHNAMSTSTTTTTTTTTTTATATPTSPAHSSPDEFDIEDDPNPSHSAQWQPSDQTSPPARAAAPLQKRRRVTRACDECRRKKIKCDGKQPCTHCTVYSYDCTYDQPSNRRRNPQPQYVEALETRLQRAEDLLRTVLPTVDLNDPDIDKVILQHQQHRRQASHMKAIPPNPPNSIVAKPSEGSNSSEHDAHIRSMIESTGHLDLDEAGHWDFHGGSSGAVFVRRMREQFGGLLGTDASGPLFPRIPPPTVAPFMFDSPRSATESPLEFGLPNTMDLPSRETARALCTDALDRACALLRFVHQPTFYESLDSVYDISPENFGDAENRFLPLLYVVLALGCMFHTPRGEDPNDLSTGTYKVGIDHGLKYFRAARGIMDITDCRDITSLQAILFMILFLQSSANLSTCYSYIGIALRSALRMGLHRKVGKFNFVERETRRRVFWVIRKMDTYVSALLGFPQMLSYEDIDQQLPEQVDDEYITKEAILPMPDGKESLLLTASNAHTKLMASLAKVIKYIYPTKGLEDSLQSNSQATFVVSQNKIGEIERDLIQWLDALPMGLRPGGECTPEVLRVQQLLRLSYAHVQMMLYRPFLHYVSQKSCAGKLAPERSYAYAAACVSIARNIVHITTEMKKRGLMVGAYWFTMYTTFFAILSLVFYVLENPDKSKSQDILSDAKDGKDALNGLAKRSQAADRCSTALRPIFERLEEKLKEVSDASSSASTSQKKKRPAPSFSNGSHEVPGPADMSQFAPAPVQSISRASTFPLTPAPIQTSPMPRTSLDGRHFQNNDSSSPNLRQSFHELMSPAAMSAAGTPDSVTTGNSIQPQFSQQQQQQQYGMNSPFPDLGAMMFSSADPFAYPNQPVMHFDGIKQENRNVMNGSPITPIYLPNGAPDIRAAGGYDDLEGQLFGPLPPYLTQGQQSYDLQMMGSDMMGGINQDTGFHAGLTPNIGDMSGILTGENEDWSQLLNDARYMQ